MDAIKENTVSAKGQMVNSSELSFLGNTDAKIKVMVLGNSILRHGPRKEIGWDRDWGMAASAPEKDFVHQLFSMIIGGGKDVYMRVRQASDWEVSCDRSEYPDFEEDKDFDADLIVFKLGENVTERVVNEFREGVKRFVYFLKKDNTKFVFATCFWKNPIVDEGIREIAKELGAPLIELGDLGDDKEMKATGQFEHTGVCAHPSDKGMLEIAKRIYSKVVEVL